MKKRSVSTKPMNGNSNGNGSFWRISFGNVISILIMAGGIVGFIVTYSSRLSSVEGSRDEGRRNIESIVQSVRDMNEHGTIYSRSGIPLETAAIITLNERVAAHDKFVIEVSPKLERISATLEILSDWIKEQKQQKRDRND